MLLNGLTNNLVNIGSGNTVSAIANYLQILNTALSGENLQKNDLQISLDKQTLQFMEKTDLQTNELLNQIINHFEETRKQNEIIIKQNEDILYILQKEVL